MSGHGAGCPLDESSVALIVAEQFPEFEGHDVVRLGAGADNETFVLDGTWVFRFPLRADQVEWQRREETILAAVADTLGGLVPSISYRGRTSDRFPYPFIGYRLLPGVPADDAEVPLERLAIQLAELFGRLHGIDASRIPPTPAGWEHEPRNSLQLTVVADARSIRAALPHALRDIAEPWLAGRTRPPAGKLRRVCHNDISAEHVLVWPDGAIAGLIDWTDTMVTDPVVDFAGLITIAGWSFIGQVVASYPLPVDALFMRRLQWLTRALTLHWLGEAAQNDGDLDRHITWVSRAFTESLVRRGPRPDRRRSPKAAASGDGSAAAT